MADISRFGSLLDPMDQEKSAVQTLQCISELLYKIQELQNSLTTFKQISNNTLQKCLAENRKLRETSRRDLLHNSNRMTHRLQQQQALVATKEIFM